MSKDKEENVARIHPNEIIRFKDGHRFFGYKKTQITEKIEEGEIPEPVLLSDTGRARGWFGQQILDYQQKRREKAAKK